MREDSFFVLKENIDKNLVRLVGDEFTHLSRVLRHKVGDRVTCFYDGSDLLVCVVKSINKCEAILEIIETKKVSSNPKNQITLFQGLPKQDKLELITKMLTEIGVSDIIPFSSKYTLGTLDAHKRERIDKIVVSACKQSKRTSLTRIHDPLPLKEIDFSNYDLVVFANEREEKNTLKDLEEKISVSQSIAYIVGAEGGFSEEEIEFLRDKTFSITLGSRVLRTETAAVILGGLLSTQKGV